MKSVANYKKLFCKITGYKLAEVVGFSQMYGGMSNQVFLVTTDDKKFILRIPFEESYRYVDYFIEGKALELLSKTNITTRCIYFNAYDGVRISEYIEGRVLSDKEIKLDNYIPKLASKLHELHALEIIMPYKYEFDILLKKYESYLTNIEAKYYDLKQLWLNKFYVTFYNEPRVFSHGDLQRSNIITSASGTNLYLLDFEFSRSNYVHFDLASFGNIDFNDVLKLTKEYFKDKPNIDSDLYKVKFFRMYQVLQWYLVALSKNQTKMGAILKLDFNEIAHNYLNQAINFSLELELSDH
jgi:thiamine kinase-like enzyme